MDDILPGVIIDGVLGIDLNVTDEFMSQTDFPISGNSAEMKIKAEVMSSKFLMSYDLVLRQVEW